MKYFITHTLIFSFPVLLFLITLEILLTNRGFTYTEQKKQLENQADSIQILILGPSYSFTGLNPRLFTLPAFNLANDNQDLYYDMKLLEKYQPTLENLKAVVFVIGYQTLDHCLSSTETEGRTRGFYYKKIFGIPRNDSSHFITDHSFLLNIGIKFSINILSDKSAFDIRNGWKVNKENSVFSETTDDPDRIVRSKLLHMNEINAVKTDQNIRYLMHAIDLCTNNRIKVLLCISPVTSYYRKNISVLKYDYVVGKLENISDNQDVFLLNLFKDPVFNDKDFSDMHHVNREGSVKFSLSVNDRLMDILAASSFKEKTD
jgi:hypothetical protein